MCIIDCREVGLVCLHTQLFLFQKHLQYKPIERVVILTAATGVPMGKNVFSFIEDQNYEGMSKVLLAYYLC